MWSPGVRLPVVETVKVAKPSTAVLPVKTGAILWRGGTNAGYDVERFLDDKAVVVYEMRGSNQILEDDDQSITPGAVGSKLEAATTRLEELYPKVVPEMAMVVVSNREFCAGNSVPRIATNQPRNHTTVKNALVLDAPGLYKFYGPSIFRLVEPRSLLNEVRRFVDVALVP